MPFAKPWCIADFESSFPFEIPERFTDNAWRTKENERRAAANAARSAAALPPLYFHTMPMWPSESEITVFCDPVSDQTSLPTGDGTIGNPFSLISSAFTAATGTSIVGIRTGRSCILPPPSMASTSNAFQITQAKAGMKVVAWMPAGAPRTPTTVRRLALVGTNPGDWEEVDLMSGGTPGVTVIRGAGGAAYTLLPNSHHWHLKTPSTLTGDVGYLGCGSYDSILEVVSPGNYASHGRNSPHIRRAWMEDIGGVTKIRVGGAAEGSGPTGKPLILDKQYDFTNNAGLVVYSTSNPATRWGGVYTSLVFHGVVVLAATGGPLNGFTWLHALQADGCGLFLRFNVGAANSISNVYIEGLYTNLANQPFSMVSSSNASPVGGAGEGTIQMAIGANTTTYGTGLKPWLQNVEIHYVRTINNLSGPAAGGWIRQCRIHDVATDMGRLQGCGPGPWFFHWSYPAGDDGLQANAYSYHNEQWNIYHKRLDCGTGLFGDSDGGVDADGGTSHIWIHDAVVDTSIMGFQLTGGQANHKVWNIAAVNCIRPQSTSDSVCNGTMEADTFNYYLEMAKVSDWQAADGTSSGIDWTFPLFHLLSRRLGVEPKGPNPDAENRLYRNVRYRNGVIFDPYSQNVVSVQNESLRDNLPMPPLPASGSPWAAVGGVGTIANNGMTVVNNQTQTSTSYIATMAGLYRVGTHGSLRVDADRDATGANPQTITAQVDDAVASTSLLNGFLLAGASATARTGGIPCLPATEGVIPHRQPGVLTDLRKVPVRTTGPSMGVYQYTPLSPVARSF